MKPAVALQGAYVVRLAAAQGRGADLPRLVRDTVAILPEPSSLGSGAMVAIGLAETKRAGGALFRRLLSKQPELSMMTRAVWCTALLARGFVRVGFGKDDAGSEWAWGWVS